MLYSYGGNKRVYLVEPVGKVHAGIPAHFNIVNNLDTVDKLWKCLLIAEENDYDDVNVYLDGSLKMNSFIGKVAKRLGRSESGSGSVVDVEGPYHLIKVADFKEDYIDRIEDLKSFWLSYGDFTCVHCVCSYKKYGIQVGGNKKGLTVLFEGISRNYVKDMFGVFL